MLYRIVFLPRVKKDFDKFSSVIKERIFNELEYISKNPLIGKSLKGEYSGLYSDRVGDYRIVYKILPTKKLIIIFKIGHRREVY